MNTTQLQAVPTAEQNGRIDSWQIPSNLPSDIAIFPCCFLGERFWKFDPNCVQLIPAATIKIEDLLTDYVGFPVLVHNHRQVILENQTDIPTEYKPYTIYWLSDIYIRCKEGTGRFVYCIKFENNQWAEHEVTLDTIPLKGQGRIILMR